MHAIGEGGANTSPHVARGSEAGVTARVALTNVTRDPTCVINCENPQQSAVVRDAVSNRFGCVGTHPNPRALFRQHGAPYIIELRCRAKRRAALLRHYDEHRWCACGEDHCHHKKRISTTEGNVGHDNGTVQQCPHHPTIILSTGSHHR